VIEIHGALCEATTAIRTGNGAQLVEDVSVVSPPIAVTIDAGRGGWRATRQPLTVLPTSPKAMTVRADDIAFGCFGKDLLPILERGPARAQRELLLAPIPMVKIHLEGLETTSAGR